MTAVDQDMRDWLRAIHAGQVRRHGATFLVDNVEVTAAERQELLATLDSGVLVTGERQLALTVAGIQALGATR